MNQAVATTADKPPIVVLRERLEARKHELKSTLPADVEPDRFISAFTTSARINLELQACDFNSLWLACLRCARDGLLPDGTEAAIVPYRERAGYVPMYKGILKRFELTGRHKWVTAQVVYEGELFEHWIDEHGEHIKHVPNEIFDDRLIRKAYAMASTKDGAIFVAVLPRAEIDKIRKSSRAQRDDAPWNAWFSEMAKKTALKRLGKLLPSAPSFEEEDGQDRDNDPPTMTIAPIPIARAPGAAAALDQFASPSASIDETPPPLEIPSDSAGSAVNTPSQAGPDDQGAAGDQSADNAGGTPGDPSVVAYKQGQEAKAAGHLRKALPGEYRGSEHKRLADAWFAGWDGLSFPML